MGNKITEAQENQLRTSFKRCSPETVEAIIAFRTDRNPELVSKIVYGIIQRYTPAESSSKAAKMTPDTRLMEDLGIDSLTMLEVVLSIEEALSIRIENEELMNIRTMKDVEEYIDKKVAGKATAEAKRKVTREEILLALPQQPPFMFLDSAEIEDDTIRAQYRITGDESFLAGHFSFEPIFPASITFEAMGQAACLWILMNSSKIMGKPLESRHVLFGSMESAHFHRKARPGELIEMEITNTKLREPLAMFSCKASVDGAKLATVEELVILFGEATQLVDKAQLDDSAQAKPTAAPRSGSTEPVELPKF